MTSSNPRAYRWSITDEDTLARREYPQSDYYYRPGAYRNTDEQERAYENPNYHAEQREEARDHAQARARVRQDQQTPEYQIEQRRLENQRAAQESAAREQSHNQRQAEAQAQEREQAQAQAREQEETRVRDLPAVVRRSNRIQGTQSDNISLNNCVGKICPITQSKITGYGIKLSDGQCYDADHIAKWYRDNPNNPRTPLRALYSDRDKEEITKWLNRSTGGTRRRIPLRSKRRVGKTHRRKSTKSNKRKMQSRQKHVKSRKNKTRKGRKGKK